MASKVNGVTLGVDVSKDWLEVYDWSQERLYRVANEAGAIKEWLVAVDRTSKVRLALEPTSHYHLAVVQAACRRGHEVYLVNPRQLHHYRWSVGLRHKSDAHDAWLLARYLAHEGAVVKPYRPLDGRSQMLWVLLKRRGMVVDMRKRIRQSLGDIGIPCREMVSSCERLIERIDRRMERLLRELDLVEACGRCRTIPGVGPLTAAALVAAYHRGAFASSDAFVAYLGLDVRLRESGTMKGRRKLSKHGEAEVRRVLYCASHAARHEPRFEAYYQRQLAKGLSKTAARVILARKLVRIAFALLNREETFQPMTAEA